MDPFTDQAAMVVGYLAAGVARRRRRSGNRLDAEVVFDAALRRLQATVEAKLGGQVTALVREAENGHVSDHTRVRMQVALEDAASKDLEFRQEVTELIARVREAESPLDVERPSERARLQVNIGDITIGATHVTSRVGGSAGFGRDGAVRPLASAGTPPVSGRRDEAFPDNLVRIPVSIYVTESGIHEQVETAVEQWLTSVDASIHTRDEPLIGSWFRRMEAGIKKVVSTPAGREALLTATHIADSRLVQAQDAYVTATLLQNVGPVLQALQPTKDAVVRAGALLIVKIDWIVQVHQLTAAQQAILDHQPHLAASPKEIIAALQLPGPVGQKDAPSPAVEWDDGSGAAAAAAE